MAQWMRALASYGRVVVATMLTATVAMGHAPVTGADYWTLGKAAIVALLPVILRALNPNDPAYGIGAKP